MKCEKCGSEIAEGASFCPSCGTRAVPTMQLPTCGKCGEPIADGTKFCAKCGSSAVVQDLKCRKCGADIPVGTKFCPGCGSSVQHGGATSVSGDDPLSSAMKGVVPENATYEYFVQGVTKKYADFSGRARRREYWFFQLIWLLVCVFAGWLPFLGQILTLALVVPDIAVTTRRLHDVGKSGWWQLLSLVPVVGVIVVFVWTIKDGDPQTNRFGPNPKA